MRRDVLVGLTSAVVAALAPIGHAQHAPLPQSTFRGGTDLIPVDVSVLDDDRRPVRGLTAADFAVMEDGRPRPIAAFSVVELRSAARQESVASWVRDAPHDVVSNDLADEGRLVAILLDGSIPDGAATLVAKQIARAAVDELGPGDLAAVVRSTSFDNNGLWQGFTADRYRLIEAIDSPFMGNTAAPEMTAAGLKSAAPVPGVGDTTRQQCEVIFDIARAMRDVPRRRKALIFVGSAIVLNGQLGSGADARSCRDDMFHELAASNVTVQAVDPVGLLTTSVAADYTTNGRLPLNLPQRWSQQNQARMDTLRVLPDRTGGRLVANTNTPQKVIPAIFAESQMYYLLGFEPASPATDGAFHTIRVQVRRRGVTVHARSGYLAQSHTNSKVASSTSGAVLDNALRPELVAALDGVVPQQDLSLSMSAAPFAVPGVRTAAVAVALGATVPAGAGPRRLDVTVGAFDRRGRSVAAQGQTLEVSAEMVRLGRVDDGLLARLDVPPGRYALRAAVKDEASGAIGSVFSFVDVPAFASGALTASGLVLHHEQPLFVADNPLADLVPIVPTVARMLSPADHISAFLRMYQSNELQTVSVMARIVDEMNRTVFTRKIELAPDTFLARAADVDIELPLNQLAPGSYLLTLEASRGASRVERDARFDISSKR